MKQSLYPLYFPGYSDYNKALCFLEFPKGAERDIKRYLHMRQSGRVWYERNFGAAAVQEMNLRIDFGLKINRVTADTQPECRMPMKYNEKDVLPQREGIFSIYSQKPGQFRPCRALL